MLTLKFRFAAALSLLFAAPMVHAQNLQDETAFMQCSMKDRDGQVSVSFNDQVAYYRFGPIGQPPELALSIPYASLQHYRPSGHDIHEISETITFQNGDYTYAVTMGFYDGWIESGDWDEEDFGRIFRWTEGDEEFGSVVVQKDGVTLADLNCQPASIAWNRNGLHQSLYAAGYKWDRIDSDAPIWYNTDDTLETYPYSGLPKSIRPFNCPYTHERPIFFSSNESRDLLSIEIRGEDCDTADVVLTITTQAGEVLHSSTAPALSYTYEFRGADGVRAMLMRFMRGQPQGGFDISSYEDLQSASPDVDIDAALVRRVRQLNLPLFCHQAGKSYSTCFVYSDGQSKLLFTSGS